MNAPVPPVPLSEDCCGLLEALSATFNAVARTPTALGWNTSMIVQLELPGRELPHVPPDGKKSELLPPTNETATPVTVVAFVFVSVKVIGELSVPTGTEPKF